MRLHDAPAELLNTSAYSLKPVHTVSYTSQRAKQPLLHLCDAGDTFRGLHTSIVSTHGNGLQYALQAQSKLRSQI